MRDIAELTVLLRVRAEMPEGLKLTRDEFREGWSRLRTGNAKRLEKKIKACKWHFICTAKCVMASGMGATTQHAITRALEHALACVSPHLNAIEVGRIQTTQYPWFWLARVTVHGYRIQPAPESLLARSSLARPQLLTQASEVDHDRPMPPMLPSSPSLQNAAQE